MKLGPYWTKAEAVTKAKQLSLEKQQSMWVYPGIAESFLVVTRPEETHKFTHQEIACISVVIPSEDFEPYERVGLINGWPHKIGAGTFKCRCGCGLFVLERCDCDRATYRCGNRDCSEGTFTASIKTQEFVQSAAIPLEPLPQLIIAAPPKEPEPVEEAPTDAKPDGVTPEGNPIEIKTAGAATSDGWPKKIEVDFACMLCGSRIRLEGGTPTGSGYSHGGSYRWYRCACGRKGGHSEGIYKRSEAEELAIK